jgi:hypothetical protein
MKRGIGVVLIVLIWLAGVNLAWQTAQLRVWNYFNWVDLLVMVALVAPFLATRWVWPSGIRATRIAWILAALMAIDIPVFVISTFAPIGSGHPSPESLVLYFAAVARVALVPTALAALCVAYARGERHVVIALGVLCLVCESVYIVPGPEHPIRWLIVAAWR